MTGYVTLELRRILRDPKFVVITLGIPLLMFGVFSRVGQPTADDIRYLAVNMAGYGAFFAALAVNGGVATDRAIGWIRQLRATPLPAGAVIGGKVVAGLAASLPAIVVVGLAASVLDGVRFSAAEWAGMLVALGLGSLPFGLLGLVIGYGARPQSAQPLTMVTFVVLSLLGGMWVPISLLPHVLQTVAHAVPTYRYTELGHALAGGTTPAAATVTALAAWTAGLGLLAALAYRRRGGER